MNSRCAAFLPAAIAVLCLVRGVAGQPADLTPSDSTKPTGTGSGAVQERQATAPAPDPVLVERWDATYRDGRRPGWDTGRPSSELKRMFESKVLRPGRVLELGCGTGVNAVYMASLGCEVTAIDLAPTALAKAEQRAKEAGVKVRWIQANVLTPPELEPFDLIFDRGCYHGVRRQNAVGYVETLKRLCRPGGQVLILAGNANEPGPAYGPPRVDEKDLVDDFSNDFDFERLREIHFDTADPSQTGAWAWSVLLRRKP